MKYYVKCYSARDLWKTYDETISWGIAGYPISLAVVSENNDSLYIKFTEAPGVFTKPEMQEMLSMVNSIWRGNQGFNAASLEEAREILKEYFLRTLNSDSPEFWGENGAFDFVLLQAICRFWPSTWPNYINDIASLGLESKPTLPHALAVAEQIRRVHRTFEVGIIDETF